MLNFLNGKKTYLAMGLGFLAFFIDGLKTALETGGTVDLQLIGQTLLAAGGIFLRQAISKSGMGK